jgi:hypothetical protein
MPYILHTPKLGARAVDHFGNVTLAQCHGLRADGVDGIFLYAEVVTPEDLANATGAWLWVGFVFEGLAAGTRPTATLGAAIATHGLERLRELGVPLVGLCVFGDIEGDGRAPEDWIALGNAQADVCLAQSVVPGGYFGEGTGLRSAEMMGMRFRRYWKGASRLWDRDGHLAEPERGWCVIQGIPMDTVHEPSGLTVDYDVVWHDYHGGTITAIIAASAPDPAA